MGSLRLTKIFDRGQISISMQSGDPHQLNNIKNLDKITYSELKCRGKNIIPYIGGKSYLSKWIIENFPKDYESKTYVEVFGGGGWVLFKKDPSFIEVYNDMNSHLVNLFRVIRDNFEAFRHRANWTLHSREMYQEAKEKLQDDEFLNEVEKAMHYATHQIQSFSGNGSAWGYVINAKKMVSGKWLPFLKRLETINARLKRVEIENLDFEKLILKYDAPNTLFYLDPPYVDVEHYYNKNGVSFGKEDHERLVNLLKNIKGKFILSYYDHELVREYYKDFNILTKETSKHSCGVTRVSKSRKKPKAIELLIKNF